GAETGEARATARPARGPRSYAPGFSNWPASAAAGMFRALFRPPDASPDPPANNPSRIRRLTWLRNKAGGAGSDGALLAQLAEGHCPAEQTERKSPVSQAKADPGLPNLIKPRTTGVQYYP